MNEKKGLFKCGKCYLSFSNYKDLDTHIKKIHTMISVKLINKEIKQLSSVKNHENDQKTNYKEKNEGLFTQRNNQKDILENFLEFENEKPLKKNENNIRRLDYITFELINHEKKYSCYEDVDEIDLSKTNIFKFNDDPSKPYFDKLNNVIIVNLSNNILTNIDDIQRIKSIVSLNISFNKIYDLNFIDNLNNLEILLANNNEISSISSLVVLNKLKVLEIQNNRICYTMSTMKTLSNLRFLMELNICNNPFLKEIEGYKHVFISKFKKLEKLDGKVITQYDIEASEEYVKRINEKFNYERPISAASKTIIPNEHIKHIHMENENDVITTSNQVKNINKSAKNFFKTLKRNDNEYDPNIHPIIQIESKSKGKNKNLEDNLNKLLSEHKRMNTKPEINNIVSFKINKNLINFSHNVEKINSLDYEKIKGENEKLLEELSFYKEKLIKLEAVIESQKLEIDNLNSIINFIKIEPINFSEYKKINIDMEIIKKDITDIMFNMTAIKKENEYLKSLLNNEGLDNDLLKSQTNLGSLKKSLEIQKKTKNELESQSIKSTYNWENLKHDLKQLKEISRDKSFHAKNKEINNMETKLSNIQMLKTVKLNK